MLIIRFELLTSMHVFEIKEFLGHSGSFITGTTYTHVSTGSADCRLISHVRSENGVEIERTRTATVLSSVTCVNREQRPYVCGFYYPVYISIIKTLKNSESTGIYEMTVRYAYRDDFKCTVLMDN